MKLAMNILSLCEKRSWTLSKLSKLSGVPIQTLHGWTTGKKVQNIDQLKSISKTLEISLHELIYGEPDPYQKIGDEILKELFTGDVRVTIHRIYRK